MRVTPDLWPLETDTTQFEQALINLANNARDAMVNGGQLTISLANVHFATADGEAPAGDYIQIEVADQGHGIAPDVMGRIYAPFFTTKDVGKGTGLGLSMVYGFVRQARGRISVESEVGQGATFRIYLPRA